jgi:hypothetical protein
MAGAALAFAGASAGLDIIGGLFGYLASQEMAAATESRGRLLRMEAEADAVRYQEQAENFKASQALAYLKSGVTLEGSPLDVLDETARVTAENLSAIRARGAAQQQEYMSEATLTRGRGRAALLGGITGAAKTAALAGYSASKRSPTAAPAPATASPTGFGQSVFGPLPGPTPWGTR